MDFRIEQQKRITLHENEIGRLAYERAVISKRIKVDTENVDKIDRLMGEHEVALAELDITRRNFDTYEVVKNDEAVILTDLKEGTKKTTKEGSSSSSG